MSTDFSFGQVSEALASSLPPARIPDSLPGYSQPVLPLLGRELLRDAVRNLTFSSSLACLKSGLLPIGDGRFAAASAKAANGAKRRGLLVVARVQRRQLHQVVLDTWGQTLCDEATFGLHRSRPVFSACNRFTARQAAAVAALAAVMGATLWLHAIKTLLSLTAGLTVLFFLAVVALRFLVFLSPARAPRPSSDWLGDEDLPIYTVLVPLFREPKVIGQLLSCLDNLDYPADKLDIKIIVEQCDRETRRELATFELPKQFEVLVVPPGHPQTKPRALNFALRLARGELLTIFDAEDLPSPRQLRIAAQRFSEEAASVACLQARLAIYNANENWLTRQFSMEYAMLFGDILPSLAALGLPIPLGGTSNHFRCSALKAVGGWDPFNVTEDADLGVRLARSGYITGVIDSDTFEEACVTYKSWHRQRARWLKGFLQTWLVHMREPLRCWRELGTAGFWVLQATTLGVFISALVHPLTLAWMTWQIIVSPPANQGLWHVTTWGAGLSLAVFFLGYAVNMLIAARTAPRIGRRQWWTTLLSSPLYWILMMPSAWLALYQFVTDVHGWNKTEHGLSKLLQQS